MPDQLDQLLVPPELAIEMNTVAIAGNKLQLDSVDVILTEPLQCKLKQAAPNLSITIGLTLNSRNLAVRLETAADLQ
jgi:hypothetical protein